MLQTKQNTALCIATNCTEDTKTQHLYQRCKIFSTARSNVYSKIKPRGVLVLFINYMFVTIKGYSFKANN